MKLCINLPPNGTVTDSKSVESNFEETLRSAPVPDWVIKMQEHFRQTGTYRTEYLRRLLGDQRRGVQVGPNASLATFLRSSQGGRSSTRLFRAPVHAAWQTAILEDPLFL